jgi:hypothetical protein
VGCNRHVRRSTIDTVNQYDFFASAHAPLFDWSTSALAYAQDPGTGAADPVMSVYDGADGTDANNGPTAPRQTKPTSTPLSQTRDSWPTKPSRAAGRFWSHSGF